jgi:hypothetical protein
MCCSLAVAVVVAPVAVGQLYQSLLLLLVVVEALALVEPSYGYLLLTLALLKQSLLALAAQEVLLKLSMIQTEI